jgi:luciferase family oxidoreductase group 1
MLKRLSVIDTAWPGNIGELAPRIEALGYHRYWATEHHDPRQSASPTLVAALAAGVTERMRVGTAGVLLPLYSPVRVVEDFRVLELLFPGRIDLGVASAVPRSELASALWAEMPEGSRSSFQDKVMQLDQLNRRGRVEALGIHGGMLGPLSASEPPIWVCGTSARSARLAGQLGLAYAFHHYLHQFQGARESGPEVVDAYRQSFQPTGRWREPTAVVAGYGQCGRSREEARQRWSAVVPNGPVPSFMGEPEECWEGLCTLAAAYGVDEVVIQALAPDYDGSILALELVAETAGLACEGASS